MLSKPVIYMTCCIELTQWRVVFGYKPGLLNYNDNLNFRIRTEFFPSPKSAPDNSLLIGMKDLRRLIETLCDYFVVKIGPNQAVDESGYEPSENYLGCPDE